MKRVLTVQDLSCLGKCSLTVALPVLSAMGHSCSVLPTAVLSTHTGFPGPFVHNLTGDMTPIRNHWRAIGAEFDAILVGYLSGPEQVGEVAEILRDFPAFTVIDPAMADHGKLYSGIREAQVQAMKTLCGKADVLIPNLTEACLLTDTPYAEDLDEKTCREMIGKLQKLGAKQVVITGVSPETGKTGFITDGVTYQTQRLNKRCHGTGDLFAAVLTGGVLQGKTVEESATLAARFVEKVIAETPEATPFGVAFEKQLKMLFPKA